MPQPLASKRVLYRIGSLEIFPRGGRGQRNVLYRIGSLEIMRLLMIC